jgi:hypothetical protein
MIVLSLLSFRSMANNAPWEPATRSIQRALDSGPIDLSAFDLTSPTFLDDIRTAYPGALLKIPLESMVRDPDLAALFEKQVAKGKGYYVDENGKAWQPPTRRQSLQRACKKKK